MTKISERKLSNYTVLFGVWKCSGGHAVAYVERDENDIGWCSQCHCFEAFTPEVEYIHVKALTPYNAGAKIPGGRLIAVFEGQIAPVLR